LTGGTSETLAPVGEEETLEKLAEKMNNKSIYRIIYKSYV